MRTLILTIFAVIIFSDGLAYAQSEWRKVPASYRKVNMSVPDLEDKNPRITIQVADSFAGRAEWVCWGKFRSLDPNACISYQVTGNSFEYKSARDINRWAKSFKKIPYSQKGELFDIHSAIGDIEVLRGKTEDNFDKECITFNSTLTHTFIY